MFQILDQCRINCNFMQCLKAIEHCKSKVYCKYHLQRTKGTPEEQQHEDLSTLVTSITGVLLTLLCSLEEAMCDEIALCPKCCCVQQLCVLGCTKPIRLIEQVCQTLGTLFDFFLCILEIVENKSG
jgi:hypothetical protein